MLEQYYDYFSTNFLVLFAVLIAITVGSLILADKIIKSDSEIEKKTKKHEDVLAVLAVFLFAALGYGSYRRGFSHHLELIGTILTIAAIGSLFFFINVICIYIYVSVRRKKKSRKKH